MAHALHALLCLMQAAADTAIIHDRQHLAMILQGMEAHAMQAHHERPESVERALKHLAHKTEQGAALSMNEQLHRDGTALLCLLPVAQGLPELDWSLNYHVPHCALDVVMDLDAIVAYPSSHANSVQVIANLSGCCANEEHCEKLMLLLHSLCAAARGR